MVNLWSICGQFGSSSVNLGQFWVNFGTIWCQFVVSLVLLWDYFGGNKTGDIVKIEGIMKKEQLRDILQRHAKRSGMRLIGKYFTLQ